MIKLGDEETRNGHQLDSFIWHTLENTQADPKSHSFDSEPSLYSQTESQKDNERTGFKARASGKNIQVLVIDDHYDSAFTVKSCLESHRGPEIETGESKSRIRPLQVTVYDDPILALLEFKPYYYDLLLIDIDMPSINGYEFAEKIVKLDPNVKVCFMSAGEVNYEAIREIGHPTKSSGCFIKKPASRDELISRVLEELY